MSIVTLTTDFGTLDGYVAAMKGVILSLAPQTQLVDMSHDIPAQDIEAGAWCIHTFWSLFPAGTIHVGVVDPGVGSDRQAILAEVDGHYFVGPDNGLFSYPLAAAEKLSVRRIPDDIHKPEGCSRTFHGRDVFAYVAGMLAAGEADWRQLSTDTDQYTLLARSEAEYTEREVRGRITHIDRYGNLISNIAVHRLPPDAQWILRVGGADLSVNDLDRAYADVAEGMPLALTGSTGHVEIAVHGGSACRVFQTDRGAEIVMRRLLPGQR